MITTRLGPATVACTDRHGGVSRPPFDTANLGDHVGDESTAVAENRRRAAERLGLPAPERWCWLRQCHGTAVVTAEARPVSGPPPEADAAVTGQPDRPLVVLTADCAPVVLAGGDAIGVVHAGWRGLLAGVVEAAVAALRRIDAAGPVRAFVGPCIGPARYEFGADDLDRMVAVLGSGVAARTAAGRPALDLPAAVRVALARAGVHDVDEAGVCTATSPDHFSYRRDGRTGRQATVVMLPGTTGR